MQKTDSKGIFRFQKRKFTESKLRFLIFPKMPKYMQKIVNEFFYMDIFKINFGIYLIRENPKC